ncbi:alpha/beta hydrolase [Paenibacillus sp. IB182493]|uniref:Alpha/beta hydrolase n=1 Tax=Paenibacillus arenilitoris TaxID=2772299 RepID=A0A927CK74_9BACL|nr:alpha/beta hydrolase-fold protein [Paenibacillus arenilitoris]MBD2868237.1 alpha/beta hydrolase [Paenibacillus arenilitoris]
MSERAVRTGSAKENELKPEIERHYPVDTNRQTIFGHSLGGLFVLTALFTKPCAFQTYIAGSPSIYWNERSLLAMERAFEAQLTGDRPVRLQMTIGELENAAGSFDGFRTEAMASRLSALGSSRLSVEFKEFRDESHISVLPVLVSQGIRFAMKNPL